MEKLGNLLLKELREVARVLEIENHTKYKKDELVTIITDIYDQKDGESIAWGELDILSDGYGFLRNTSVEKDIYVSASQIRKFLLRKGDLVIGEVREPSETERNYALKKLFSVNGESLEKAQARIPFDELVPGYPMEQVVLEAYDFSENVSGRIIDLISPIGKGQRGLIVAPPKAGKTMLISQIANSIIKNNSDIEVWILLIDERPEEVTDIKESVKGAKVFASTFDEDPKNHIKVTESVLETAKRKLEDGYDILILMDSLTRLARAYNIVIPSSGKLISGGIDPMALYHPKKFFGAARNIKEGGSLTIIATALIDTGSKMDDVIYEEFKGTGNMDIHLDRNLAELRIYPAIDIQKSGTRKEELLIESDKLDVIWNIRRQLAKYDKVGAAKLLIDAIKKSRSNKELLEVFLGGDK
jgi:transcription termination factor Rho